MVFDRLPHAHLYERMTKHIHHAFAFLRRADLATLPVGRYDLAGDDAYALVQQYDTKPADAAKWEAHQTYIDVQFMAAGAERMGYAHIDTMQPTMDYNAEKDYQLFTGNGVDLVMTPGTFAIFSPHDVHRPTVSVDGQPAPVRKVVVKVRVD